ncbi:MAG TPA: metallophosphoesterase [Acetobacteraceae bacterium]|nr:metallophosphoesterase [Acetobacteraceae bacterium]
MEPLSRAAATTTAPTLPPGARIRVVGDVHGDAAAFAYACATDRFVLQLGDLIDHGPDSAGTLRAMFRLIDARRGLYLLGNHDLKLARALAGHATRPDHVLAATIEQLDAALRERVMLETARAPAWLRRGDAVFVHGGFHSTMLEQAPPDHGLDRPRGAVARALYGEPTGRTQPDGYPERSLRWVDRIPPGITVYCGHDQRSTDGRPYVRPSAAGGRAVFLDTGAGKGGHLSWIDI